jgi:type IV pilus assembly protein PilV
MSEQVPGMLPLRSAQEGIMLLEALIAVLIFSIGLIGLMGLQAVAIKETSGAKYRSDASYIADQVIGNLSATNMQTIADSVTDIPERLPQGRITVTTAGSAANGFTVTVQVTWQPPGDTTQRSFSQSAYLVDS